MLLPGIGWPGGSPENSGIVVGVILGAYLGAVWLAAIIWTVRDVRERSRDPITQAIAVLIVVVLNLPGWVLYLVLRPPLTLTEVYERQLEEEALLQGLTDELACPQCSAEVREDYVVCPHCMTRLKRPCTECGRGLSFAWTACPWCASPREPMPALAAPIGGGADEAIPSHVPRTISPAPTGEPSPREAPREGSPFSRPGAGAVGRRNDAAAAEEEAAPPPTRLAAGGEQQASTSQVS